MQIQGLTTNFKAKRQNFGIRALLTLLFIGGIFAGVGIPLLQANKIDPSWPRINCKVVGASSSINDGSTTYTPIVQYQVNGRTYKIAGGSSSSSYPDTGSSREVAYNPEHPDNARVVEGALTSSLLYLFPVIGVGLLVLGPVLFIKSLRRSGKIRQLQETGHKLQGVLTDIQSGNNEGYKIVVTATDSSGVVQNYVSDYISGIGSLTLADFRNKPIPIDVYVNPSNPKKYYVDVSDIPNLTPARVSELLKSAVTNTAIPPSQTPPINPMPSIGINSSENDRHPPAANQSS